MVYGLIGVFIFLVIGLILLCFSIKMKSPLLGILGLLLVLIGGIYFGFVFGMSMGQGKPTDLGNLPNGYYEILSMNNADFDTVFTLQDSSRVLYSVACSIILNPTKYENFKNCRLVLVGRADGHKAMMVADDSPEAKRLFYFDEPSEWHQTNDRDKCIFSE